MGREKDEVDKNAKREQGQYPAILTEQAWSTKNLLYGLIHQVWPTTRRRMFPLVIFKINRSKLIFVH